jgi:DNA-binding transcriptional regulator YiaG
MSLIFNNPFCHPALIAKELQSINYNHCEDSNPKNPAPDETEINAIISTCYQKFVSGELDFTKVIRKKKNYKDISKKKVFCSKLHVKMKPNEKQRQCYKTYTVAKRNKNIRLYEEAISALQDGTKITPKRIAEYMGMSVRNLRRYKTKAYDDVINEYNQSLGR